MDEYSNEDMIYWLSTMAREKHQWLEKFGKGKDRRQDWELRQARDRVKALEQAKRLYERMAERNPSHVHSQSR